MSGRTRMMRGRGGRNRPMNGPPRMKRRIGQNKFSRDDQVEDEDYMDEEFNVDDDEIMFDEDIEQDVFTGPNRRGGWKSRGNFRGRGGRKNQHLGRKTTEDVDDESLIEVDEDELGDVELLDDWNDLDDVLDGDLLMEEFLVADDSNRKNRYKYKPQNKRRSFSNQPFKRNLKDFNQDLRHKSDTAPYPEEEPDFSFSSHKRGENYKQSIELRDDFDIESRPRQSSSPFASERTWTRKSQSKEGSSHGDDSPRRISGERRYSSVSREEDDEFYMQEGRKSKSADRDYEKTDWYPPRDEDNNYKNRSPQHESRSIESAREHSPGYHEPSLEDSQYTSGGRSRLLDRERRSSDYEGKRDKSPALIREVKYDTSLRSGSVEYSEDRKSRGRSQDSRNNRGHSADSFGRDRSPASLEREESPVSPDRRRRSSSFGRRARESLSPRRSPRHQMWHSSRKERPFSMRHHDPSSPYHSFQRPNVQYSGPGYTEPPMGTGYNETGYYPPVAVTGSYQPYGYQPYYQQMQPSTVPLQPIGVPAQPVYGEALPDMSQPPPVQPDPTAEEAAKKEEARKEAIKKEKRQQKLTLTKQREEYNKKASVLSRELNLLSEQRDELVQSKSGPNDKLLNENAKLQHDIQNKLKAINNVIDMLTGIIGDDGEDLQESQEQKEEKKVEPKVEEVVVPSTSAEPDNKEKEDDKEAPFPVYNYVYYDPEQHWCRVCDAFPQTAKAYLNHLHSAGHMQEIQRRNLIDMSWHEKKQEETDIHHKGAPVRRLQIKGLQFFISATAWYCKLCDIWMGDLHCASLHLKSKGHSGNYMKFIEKNPHWETDWLANREKAFQYHIEKRRQLKEENRARMMHFEAMKKKAKESKKLVEKSAVEQAIEKAKEVEKEIAKISSETQSKDKESDKDEEHGDSESREKSKTRSKDLEKTNSEKSRQDKKDKDKYKETEKVSGKSSESRHKDKEHGRNSPRDYGSKRYEESHWRGETSKREGSFSYHSSKRDVSPSRSSHEHTRHHSSKDSKHFLRPASPEYLSSVSSSEDEERALREEDPSKSIRVSMRKKEPSSKPFWAYPVKQPKSRWDSPEPEERKEPREPPSTRLHPEDASLQEWMSRKPDTITESEKLLLTNIKDRVKGKQDYDKSDSDKADRASRWNVTMYDLQKEKKDLESKQRSSDVTEQRRSVESKQDATVQKDKASDAKSFKRPAPVSTTEASKPKLPFIGRMPILKQQTKKKITVAPVSKISGVESKLEEVREDRLKNITFGLVGNSIRKSIMAAQNSPTAIKNKSALISQVEALKAANSQPDTRIVTSAKDVPKPKQVVTPVVTVRVSQPTVSKPGSKDLPQDFKDTLSILFPQTEPSTPVQQPVTISKPAQINTPQTYVPMQTPFMPMMPALRAPLATMQQAMLSASIRQAMATASVTSTPQPVQQAPRPRVAPPPPSMPPPRVPAPKPVPPPSTPSIVPTQVNLPVVPPPPKITPPRKKPVHATAVKEVGTGSAATLQTDPSVPEPPPPPIISRKTFPEVSDEELQMLGIDREDMAAQTVKPKKPSPS